MMRNAHRVSSTGAVGVGAKRDTNSEHIHREESEIVCKGMDAELSERE